MSEILPNDRPPVTDLPPRVTSGFLRNTSVSPGAMVSLALGAAALGIAVASRYRRRDTCENKVVVVTGGSRGLGLVLARELAAEGALLGLMARDAIELARARRTIGGDSHFWGSARA